MEHFTFTGFITVFLSFAPCFSWERRLIKKIKADIITITNNISNAINIWKVNSRGVAINHVRGILKEIDGIELVYDKGLFRIEYTDEFYCDYLACVKLLMINNTGGNATELIGIVSRGKFLRSIDMPEFDSFKGNLEQKLEPVLLIEIENCFKKEAYKIVVALCESLFYIDPINDEALCYAIQSLTKMNMVNEAKVQYLKFSVEYMNTMNTEYPYSFTDIQKRV